MSANTPRTDKVCRQSGPLSHRQRRRLYLKHARQLESELAEAQADKARLEAVRALMVNYGRDYLTPRNLEFSGLLAEIGSAIK